MSGENSSTELQSLLEAITSSDVVENRVQLLTRLEELDICNKTDLISLMASLTIFWEDFTCLDISQCLLNKTILHVAAKHIESDLSGCLGHFLSLGTKASIWGGKHLKMTLMATDESQEEEHYNLFFQLLLDLLNYSAACFSSLAKYPVADDKELMIIVEIFTLEQLNLTKDSISEIKRIDGVGLEVLKVAQRVLDAVIRLCRVYFSSINPNLHEATSRKDQSCLDSKEADNRNHVVSIIKCTINQLCEIGVLAAHDGGNLVSLLSSSWKGVVTLLQLGNGALVSKLNVADIILTLISLAKDSLRGAAKNWSLLSEPITESEAKRIFVPVKFYLINAGRISSQYPYQAFSVYKDISLCVLTISTFGILLSKNELLKPASEVLAEILEPTSFHLLSSLLNSAELKQVDKFLILDWLFHDENNSNLMSGDPTNNRPDTSKMDAIFALSCDQMNGVHSLLLGRVSLFLNLLKSAPDIDEDVRLGIARKLGWILKVLVDEEAYASCLTLKFPIPCGSSKAPEIAYQPMFFSIFHALKSFMIFIASTDVWKEMEAFLLDNFFHPHFLCWEVVMELWCLLMRHAEEDMMNDIVEKLFLLLVSVAAPESVLVPSSALRKAARSTCLILMQAPQSTVDRFYGMIADYSTSQSLSFVFVALLMEGLPLNLLSDTMKSSATQRIVTDYFEFAESFGETSLSESGYGLSGSPVFVLSAALQSLQFSISDIDLKTLRFLVAILHSYRNTEENSTKSHYRKLLSETLGIISKVEHLYKSDGMAEVILELQKLFISASEFSDPKLYECKPNLASFMAGLGDVQTKLYENSATSSAIWELFHVILRERHWAFAHLSIAAFGHFAAHTSCNELWRFVPQNAALSFDLESGNEADEERFLSELKAFLEKEPALATTTSCRSDQQLQLLVKEGQVLKEMAQKLENIAVVTCGEAMMEIDIETQSNKKRKLPDEISQGIELLQSGLKVLGDGLPQMQQNHSDSTEFHHKFITHLSCLEEVISQLVGLAGTY